MSPCFPSYLCPVFIVNIVCYNSAPDKPHNQGKKKLISPSTTSKTPPSHTSHAKWSTTTQSHHCQNTNSQTIPPPPHHHTPRNPAVHEHRSSASPTNSAKKSSSKATPKHTKLVVVGTKFGKAFMIPGSKHLLYASRSGSLSIRLG